MSKLRTISNLGKYHKINNDDELINDSLKCSICLDKYKVGEYKRKLTCGHKFHKKCIDKWFKYSNDFRCPICRKNHADIKLVVKILENLKLEIKELQANPDEQLEERPSLD